MSTYEITRVVNAPQSVAWDVISRVDRYHEAATNLHSVEVLSGSGVGMVRRCTDHDGKSWTESCTLWHPGEAYVFEVDTRAPGYPFPLKKMRGMFRAEPLGPNKTKIVVRFDYSLKYPVIGSILGWLMSRMNAGNAQALMDNWESQITELAVAT